MRSQRGGRGKERGFSFGAVDIFVAVVRFLEIVDSLGCMYGGCRRNGGGMVGRCGGELIKDDAYIFVVGVDETLEASSFPTFFAFSQYEVT